jgi:hypothetical protein
MMELPPFKLDLPNSKLKLPPFEMDLPNSVPELPPFAVDLPNSVPELPPFRADLPNSKTDLLPATVCGKKPSAAVSYFREKRDAKKEGLDATYLTK